MVKNIAASVKQRLLNQARNTKSNLNDLLDRYARERFLYRLSQSKSSQQYILKGASVFQVWLGNPHRSTKDIDLLGFGSNAPQTVEKIFAEICQLDCNDGIQFTNITSKVLQAGQKYEGVRLNIEGKLETALLFLQIDIGFGHIVTPQPKIYQLPSLLDFPAPSLLVYPQETVIAEKLQAIVSRGLKNSRIKDYYDILYLRQNFEFNGELLKQAIKATFNQRQTPLPVKNIPVGLTSEFIKARPDRDAQWKKLYQQGTMDARPKFENAISLIAEFVLPPLQAAGKNLEFNQNWQPQLGWQELELDSLM
jgi:predicted nucleotidyltransferase component of viral defense system